MAKSEKLINCIAIESIMEFLFVYGTLQDPQNQVAQFLQSNAEFYAEGYFHGKLFDLGDYPGAIESKNPEDKVFGSIFKVRNPDAVFVAIDEYEETGDKFPSPNEFIRKKIDVFVSNGEMIPSYVYLYNWPVEHYKRIVSGKYIRK